ncbi:hypothetical protein V8D89_004621 [Ganoderma adspersum]
MSSSGAIMASRLLAATALPPNPYSPLTHPNWHAAYACCIPLEQAGMFVDVWFPLVPAASPEVDMLQTSVQVAGRTLGYALIHAPNDVARDCVAREINGCEDNVELLVGLAHVYIFGFIRIFMNPNGLTPMDESPRGPSEALRQEYNQTVVPPGTTPKWLGKQLLAREQHRCVFTDRAHFRSIARGDVDLAATGRSRQGGHLEAAHIVSQLLPEYAGLEGIGIGGMTQAAQDKLRWASSRAGVLGHLAGVDIQDILPDLDIHHPANTLMADSGPHDLFKQLELWLTPSLDDDGDVLADTYDIHLQYPDLAPFVGRLPRTRFEHYTTPDGVDVAPPSRTLLEIHASCAKVAHMSGAAEVLDRLYGENGVLRGRSGSSLGGRDMSTNPVASADELVRALRQVQVGGE